MFGSSRRPLFGVHEPPRSTAAKRTPVLLCYPGVQEYNMAHWAFRRLSGMLAREGHHTLRFDWTGSGDSAGDPSDAGIDDWLDDVRAAEQELRDATSASAISIVGMRLGASLAALACPREGIECIVLWEPVVTGKRYVDELEALHASQSMRFLHDVKPRGGDELGGYPFPASLRRALLSIDLRSVELGAARRAAIVAGAPRDDHRSLDEALAGRRVPFEYRVVPEDTAHAAAGRRESALLGNRSLAAIQEVISGGPAT